MERIIIEVDDTIARKWRYASLKTKEQTAKRIDDFLRIVLDKPEQDIWPFLETLRIEAEKKGFNDSILNSILNEE
jgi:hypothetical protein